jgi:quinol monooxygenase YgiN
MLVVAGTIALDPAKRDAATVAFDAMREATLKEPGCLAYQAYFDRSDPGVLFLFERWESDAALKAHFAAPHMAEFGKAMGSFGIRSTDIIRYDVSADSTLL